MQYRSLGKCDSNVSVLGYGCMRFPSDNGKINMELTEKQIRLAIGKGVNYFDTAYMYRGSEEALGEILSKGLRDKVKIATKVPPYMARNRAGMERVLKTQLERLKTDYIDFYLLHALTDYNAWLEAKTMGFMEFLEEEKSKGRIRNIGFSYHGDKENFKKIIDDYNWDFCQIQYNYIDENYQAGREGLKYAYSKGIGVVVMEPLRGGSLVGGMPEAVKKIWDSAPVKRSSVDWALRWIWDQPEVSVVLSGMNEERQVEENAILADEIKVGNLTDEEKAIYEKSAEQYLKLMKVGCTGCSYCMPCPMGVNIPFCFSYYNTYHMFGKKKQTIFQYIGFAGGIQGGQNSLAYRCIKCGKCERVCPQHLPIRKHLEEVHKEMEPFWVKPALWTAKKVFKLIIRKNRQDSKEKAK